MSCRFYTFRSNDYYCCKKQEYVCEDDYRRYCRDYSYDECPVYQDEEDESDSDSDSGSGGCYLTTACVTARGLPDDCQELTILRDFRDNWLKKQPDGPADVAEYYATAPGIVAEINALPNAKEIWGQLYETLVEPCVKLIQSGKMEETYVTYKKSAMELRKKYLN
jgi:hypothetical protein